MLGLDMVFSGKSGWLGKGGIKAVIRSCLPPFGNEFIDNRFAGLCRAVFCDQCLGAFEACGACAQHQPSIFNLGNHFVPSMQAKLVT